MYVCDCFCYLFGLPDRRSIDIGDYFLTLRLLMLVAPLEMSEHSPLTFLLCFSRPHGACSVLPCLAFICTA